MKKIDVEDIRKGDRIRYEYPKETSHIAHEYIAIRDGDLYGTVGQNYLMERPYVLPTEDGIYVRADSSIPYYNWHPYHLVDGRWGHPSFGLDHEATVERLTSRKIELMRLVPEKED